MASVPRMPASLKASSRSKTSEILNSSLREDIPSRVDASFALHYLHQAPVPSVAVDWEAYSGSCVFNIQTAPSERRIYEPLCAILTKMSLTVHKELNIQGPRLIFQDSHARKPSGIPGCRYMPGIRCIEFTAQGEGVPTLVDAQETSWLETVSLVEVKKSEDAVWHAASYAHVAPTARPDIAGMLYLMVSRQSVQLHWSDASGIVSSPSYKWSSPETPRIIFNYIRTLYQPLPDHPHFDKTITKAQDFDKDNSHWSFQVGNMTYTCKILFSAPAHGRQTSIARTIGEGPVHVIKDTWHDTRRRFTEAALIEKVHSQGTVPGVIRLESSALVVDSSNQPLRTSARHLGDSEQPSSLVPREKVRNVFASTGKPLEERESVLPLLKVLYDVVEAHRVCLSRGVLHRDLSVYNILIEPKHPNGTQNAIKDATYIEQVLNPLCSDVKEQGLIIDFDNASALDEPEPDSKAKCIGTPMFIAEAVAQGGWFEEDFLRPIPSLSGRALELYKKAYGGYRYAEYSSVTERAKLKPTPLPPFEQQGYHDMESIFWILVWEFLCAWPEGAEPELSPSFERAYDVMANHTFDDIEDSRSPLRNSRAGYAVTWGARVHPRLHPLLPMLHQMDLFLRTEWYWFDDLPVDHCHEVMRRLLLGEIVWMEEQGDEIPLRRERRRPACREDTTRRRSSPAEGIKRGASV